MQVYFLRHEGVATEATACTPFAILFFNMHDAFDLLAAERTPCAALLAIMASGPYARKEDASLHACSFLITDGLLI